MLQNFHEMFKYFKLKYFIMHPYMHVCMYMYCLIQHMHAYTEASGVIF